MKALSAFLPFALCPVLTCLSPLSASRADLQHVFVSVIDDRGQPISGLTASDFAVQLDGTRQTIEAVIPAREPLSMALLTDRLGLSTNYTQFDVQRALLQFVRVLRQGHPEIRIAFSTFDGPVLPITRFTSPPADLDRALARLSSNAPDSTLLDAVADASRTMLRAPTSRRVIFALVSAYRPDQSTERSDAVGELLQLSGASLWAVEAVRDLTQGGNSPSPPRELILESATTLSGGFRQIVSKLSDLEPALTQAANQILGQYDISYAPGGGTRRSRLVVGVRRADARVLAPSWISR